MATDFFRSLAASSLVVCAVCTLLAILSRITVEEAHANTSYAGHWQCEWGMRDPGSRLPAVSGQFNAALYPNYRFEATGMQGSGFGTHLFTAVGQWQFAENGIEMSGHMMLQGVGQTNFGFYSRVVGPNNLAYTQERTDGQILVSQCVRSG